MKNGPDWRTWQWRRTWPVVTALIVAGGEDEARPTAQAIVHLHCTCAVAIACAVALPFASAYKDVFAFGVVIALMAWRPTGLIQEKISERV